MRVTAAICVVLLLIVSGCKQNRIQRNYKSVQGIATQIDHETGQVAMARFDPITQEQGKVFSGQITPQTEILINGISARLEDVQVGDQAIVTVYPSPERRDQWIVTRAEVLREESYILSRPLPFAAPTLSVPSSSTQPSE